MNLISLIFVKLSSASVSCGHFSFFQYWRYYLLYRQKVQPSCYFCSDDKDLDLGCFYSSKIKTFPGIHQIFLAILVKYSANPWSLLHIYGHINVIFVFDYRNSSQRSFKFRMTNFTILLIPWELLAKKNKVGILNCLYLNCCLASCGEAGIIFMLSQYIVDMYFIKGLWDKQNICLEIGIIRMPLLSSIHYRYYYYK